MSSTPSSSAASSGNRPLVSTTYLRVALDVLVGDDVGGRERLLEGTGIDPGDVASLGPVMPFGPFLQALGNTVRSRSPGWHLELAPHLDASMHGPLGFAALTAPTLAGALQVLRTYSGSRVPFAWFAGSHRGDRHRVEVHPVGELGALEKPLMELTVLAVVMLVTQVGARNSRELRVLIPGVPPSYRAVLEAALRAPVGFEADGYAVDIPQQWLERPSPLADPEVHQMNLSRCRDLQARLDGRSPLETSVRLELLALRGQAPGLAALAAQHHMSPRTLIRQLARSGTSYQEILDEVRASLAGEWLRDTDLTVQEIAHRLGFRDPSNFGRAFRGWYRTSPGRYRQQSRERLRG